MGRWWNIVRPAGATVAASALGLAAFVVAVGAELRLAGAASAQVIAFAAPGNEHVVDDFEDLSLWSTSAPEGADVKIVPDQGSSGRGMRIDFDFHSSHGFVIVRRKIDLNLPRNFVFFFDMRGQAPANDLELKLVDGGGRNVWRRVLHDVNFPAEWSRVRVRKSRLGFEWGPNPEAELDHVGAIEIAIAAGSGGGGSIWVDQLRYEERDIAPSADGFRAKASTATEGHAAAMALDGDPKTVWHSAPESTPQWLQLDLTRPHEFGGLVIDWDPADYATKYAIEISDDEETWTSVHRATRGNGGRDYIYLPDGEARYIRLAMETNSRGEGCGVVDVIIKPPGFATSLNEFFQAIARDAPPGEYPKYLLSRQSYWTVVGSEKDEHEALINEEGMVEIDTQTFSIEPFLQVDGALWTWNDVSITQALTDGYLPIPQVTWRRDDLELVITAFASAPPAASTLYVRYALRNGGQSPRNAKLSLALRPFQVSPPWQSLNMVGGVSPVRSISFDGQRVRVNGDKTVMCLVPPDAFGAAAFQEGSITEYLRRDAVPPSTGVDDDFGYASAALRYDLALEPGQTREIAIAVPFHGTQDIEPSVADPAATIARVAAEQERTANVWRGLLQRVELRLPRKAQRITDTIKATLAYILINRDGDAIQPGSRAYNRSWIRDGALTSTALLQFGFPSQVRSFLEWYAAYQFSDGKIPCCIDRRGADPTPEHDSNGEFIYSIAEYYRFTKDVGLVHDLWPRVLEAVDYLAELRNRRMSKEYGSPENKAFFGLLPESISHEGYSAHPVHSYWDDFFALRGLKDAASIALALGDEDRAGDFSAFRDEFRSTLYASIAATMADHSIDYIPGSVELGDFDPTSTAIAVNTAGEVGNLPQRALNTTFRRYSQYVHERRRGQIDWDAYSAYELRNVQVLMRLGWRHRAIELLDWLLDDQRPVAWRQWPEISWRDHAAPRFIGDLPHTWVASAFLSSIRSMLVYERESDNALVVGAGVPRSWLTTDSGIEVRRLPTHYGVINYRLRRLPGRTGSPRLQLEIGGDLQVPPGGIVIMSPLLRPLRAVSVNGRAVLGITGREARIREFPADILLAY